MGDKGKKLKVEEKAEEENAELIDGDLVVSIEKLQEIQDELEKINEEATDKFFEVEKKYNEERKLVYDKRNDIIKSIPDFWLTAFLSHPALCDLLTEEDQKIFKYLSSLEVEDFKDEKSGYAITFNFKPNPYFEDIKLTKSYTFLDEGPTKIAATMIKWKEGMGVRNGVAHEKTGSKRPRRGESLFTWFSEVQQKNDVEEIQDEVAEIIMEDLWCNPLTYFNNDGDEDDSDGEEDDEEEKGNDGCEEDDEEEDDDEGDKDGN